MFELGHTAQREAITDGFMGSSPSGSYFRGNSQPGKLDKSPLRSNFPEKENSPSPPINTKRNAADEAADKAVCQPPGMTRRDFGMTWKDFPGGLVAKTPHSQCRGPGLISGRGTRSHTFQLKIPCTTTKNWCSQIPRY